jgi:GDPmannose 4,6-dehydratase
MLQAKSPDTYVLATNRTVTVREFINMAAIEVGINIEWQGKEAQEQGIDTNTGQTIIKINPQFYRPAEVELLIGDPEKAMLDLGWKPKVSLENLVGLMMQSDMRRNTQKVVY